jgi:hypothetical protein
LDAARRNPVLGGEGRGDDDGCVAFRPAADVEFGHRVPAEQRVDLLERDAFLAVALKPRPNAFLRQSLG